jgi:hypothetical protein
MALSAKVRFLINHQPCGLQGNDGIIIDNRKTPQSRASEPGTAFSFAQ